MQCPYRNMTNESGCDLVSDKDGISGVMQREFCDYRQCQECPLFQEALLENLREWSKHDKDEDFERSLAESPEVTSATPVAGFWKLVLESRHPHHAR